MPLLPGGDREDASRVKQVAYTAIAIWAGYQALVNLHHYSAAESNLHSLIGEINTGGEDSFRKRFVEVLRINDVPLDPDALLVTFDPKADEYSVEVPFTWNVNLYFWHATYTVTLHNRISRVQYG